MKKVLGCLIVMLFLGFGLSPSRASAEPGKIQFCETLTDKFEPINPGDKFPGPTVSWLATSPTAFGKHKIVVSIYRDKDGVQSLLTRRELEVNPSWNNVGLSNMPVSEPGNYTLTLSQEDGAEIASGSVTILDSVNDQPAKPEKQIGGALEELFNKYKPKNK